MQNGIINKKIRICIECGNTSIRIEDDLVNCTECGKKFLVVE